MSAIRWSKEQESLAGLRSSGSGALALQLVRSGGSRFDWPEPWRARLRTLRPHPVEDVAILAKRVWTSAQ